MKRRIWLFTRVSVILFPVLFSCGGKKPEPVVLVFGGDTLSVQQVRRLDPVGTGDSVRFRNVGLRLLLAGALPDSPEDGTVEACRERLELFSNTEWSSAAAGLLLRAADSILTYSSSDPQTCAVVRSKTRNLMRKITEDIVKPPVVASFDSLMCDSMDFASNEGKLFLVGKVLGVEDEIAKLIMEFVGEEDTSAALDGVALKHMIDGLVKKKGEEGEKTEKETPKGAPGSGLKHRIIDNPDLVMRFRNRESVRDSIEKHIPNLKQLYRKHLKSGGRGLSGKVVATIRVSARGKVINVSIKESDISNRAFLTPFMTYLKTIRFLPVPEKVGAISFDFPFEFTEEL